MSVHMSLEDRSHSGLVLDTVVRSAFWGGGCLKRLARFLLAFQIHVEKHEQDAAAVRKAGRPGCSVCHPIFRSGFLFFKNFYPLLLVMSMYTHVHAHTCTHMCVRAHTVYV